MNITPIEITVADIFSGFKDNQEAGVERALHIRAFTPGQNIIRVMTIRALKHFVSPKSMGRKMNRPGQRIFQ